MGRNQQSKGGGYAGNKGNKTYASGGRSGGNKHQTVDAATALRLGVPQQNTMLAGMAGLGMVQHNPLDSPFWIDWDERCDGAGWLRWSWLTVRKQWE